MKVQVPTLTPQAILRARFGELAESLDIDLRVSKQTNKFYFTVTGHWRNTERFMQASFPGAWMTSGAGDEVVYGLPLDLVARVLAESRVDPAWLEHNDSAALGIARHIRHENAFDVLPILADALQEGGCDHQEILEHCRARAPHQQTCWVVDLLLGPKRLRRRNNSFGPLT
jgi:hypothetical protein